MRWLLALTVTALMGTTQAQASYLHVRTAHRAVAGWLPNWADQLGGVPGATGPCHRLSGHRLECRYVVMDVSVGRPSVEWEGRATVTLKGGKALVRDTAFR